jgi:hypothetical protein
VVEVDVVEEVAPAPKAVALDAPLVRQCRRAVTGSVVPAAVLSVAVVAVVFVAVVFVAVVVVAVVLVPLGGTLATDESAGLATSLRCP